MARLDELLRRLKEDKGSDLHLAAGLEPRMRISGTVKAVPGLSTLSDEELRSLLREIASEADWAAFEESCDLDFAYGLEGVARFRANYFAQDRGAAAVFRIIPETILSLDTLGLPPAIARLSELSSGLVLVTGPTGSGKSTTLAAIIHRINESFAKHVVTIEDPIEFVHQNRRSVFSQREVGEHTGSFSSALRAAIRQNPDVILVGEMRDRETIQLAITAAEMGMLVFGTLHTNSAAKSIDRLIDAVPAEEQDQLRLSLSESLSGIVSQLLLKTPDGRGRCAAVEILLRTKALPNVIREGNTPMINNIIQQGRSLGMQSMDESLMQLVRSERITPLEAYNKAHEKQRFEPLLSQ